jgi:hypothetical protein
MNVGDVMALGARGDEMGPQNKARVELADQGRRRLILSPKGGSINPLNTHLPVRRTTVLPKNWIQLLPSRSRYNTGAVISRAIIDRAIAKE